VEKNMPPEKKQKALKQFFTLMVIWLVTIIAVFAGSMLYDQHKASKYEAIAEPYIKRIIPELSQWDPAITKALMSSKVAATIPDENFTQAATLFSRLGALQSMEEPKFDKVQEMLNTDIGTLTIVEYNVDAKYENGEAVINLQLLDGGGFFEIYRFNFSSEILLE
jgi:hypothetical protein